METKKKALLLLFLLIAAIAIYTSPLTNDQEVNGNINELDFTLPNLNDEQVTLSNYEGQIIIIDFMGTDCPSCEDEITELKEIKNQFGEQITILSIATNTKESLSNFKQQKEANWQFLIDGNAEVFQKYGVEYIPTIYIFNQEGEIIYKKTGLSQSEELKQKIQENM